MPVTHQLESLQHLPASGRYLGARVKVCFNYDTSALYGGVVVRDDTTEPGLMIIRLDSGEHLTSLECQWSLDGGNS
jgi:hypothetical protein